MHNTTGKYQPFNQDFCAKLEYRITEALCNADNSEWNSLWCDGILHDIPSDRLADDYIIENKSIITKALIGEDGQGQFVMHIILGEQSLKNYLTRKPLEACIPQTEAQYWIEFDLENMIIKVTLN